MPRASVLLLEAGGRDWHPYIHIPLGMGRMHEYGMFDWGYRDRSRAEPQQPAHRGDARQGVWAAPPRSTSWPIRAAIAAITTAGRRRARAAGPMPTCCPISGAARLGRAAKITWRGGERPARHRIRQDRKTRSTTPGSRPARRCGYPLTPDYNGKQQEGFGRSQYTIRDGRRSSSANAFLKPARGRKNLTVATNAHTTRVLLEGTRATGVEYVQDGRDRARRARRAR